MTLQCPYHSREKTCPFTLCRCCWCHKVTSRPCLIHSAATASFELEKYADAIDWADRGLQVELSNKELIELRQKAVKAKAAKEKRERMAAARERKEAKERQLLEAGIKVRRARTGLVKLLSVVTD